MITGVAGIVAEHPLLRGLPDDVLDSVAGCARNVAFPAGHLLTVEGLPADTFFLLRRGRVGVEVHIPGREPRVIETLDAGQVVGWSWLFPPYRWHFDVRSLTPCGAVAIDAACLRSKAEADPALGYELMKRISSVVIERLQATRLRLLDLYGRDDR